MKKIFPVMLILLIASPSIADTVYLNNGQSFRADLVRVTSDEIIVAIGGVTEVDFEKSTIARVEDDAGKILFEGKKVMVPRSSEPEPSKVVVPDPSEVGPSEVGIPEAPEPESSDDDAGIVYTPGPKPTRFNRFYTGALDKGSLALGGLVSFSSFGGDVNEGAYGIENNERLNLFAIAPSITFFLFDHIGIGADFMYKREWLNSHFEDQLSLGPRAIYAFPFESAFRPYVGAGIGLMRWRFSENERAYSDIGMSVKVEPGVFYFVNENYAVNMELTYKWDRFGTDLEDYPITGNSFLFSVGLTGFIY